ncbi:MAG: metal ABC transporter permease [Alphaproteobacteria bacterium]|nr:metal ABC transporter permease [Alphaproteobacteria bacterium]
MSVFSDPALQRAMLGAALVALSGAPLGVFLVLRRMSLIGDVMAHAILPGIAAAFILYGLSFTAMGIGGLVTGLAVALVAGFVARVTDLREDASLAAFYLIAVAAGVLMIALHGTAQNLEDILFGNAWALNSDMLRTVAAVCAITLGTLMLMFRLLVAESFDPVFLRSVGGKGGLAHAVFMGLTVLNMVESYRAMGTLMSAGLMLIPAIAAQFWTQRLHRMIAVAVGIGMAGAASGLWIAFTYNVPSGPAIVLIVGGIYILSLLFGKFGSVRARYFPFRHLQH